MKEKTPKSKTTDKTKDRLSKPDTTDYPFMSIVIVLKVVLCFLSIVRPTSFRTKPVPSSSEAPVSVSPFYFSVTGRSPIPTLSETRNTDHRLAVSRTVTTPTGMILVPAPYGTLLDLVSVYQTSRLRITTPKTYMSPCILELSIKYIETLYSLRFTRNGVSPIGTYSVITTTVTTLVFRSGDGYEVLRDVYTFIPTTTGPV